MMNDDRKTMITRVAPELHKAVKLVAAESGDSANKVVENALANFKPVREMLKVIGG